MYWGVTKRAERLCMFDHIRASTLARAKLLGGEDLSTGAASPF